VHQPWTQITEPGTIDDLVADATAAGYEANARLIHSWIPKGLLDRPQRRPKGRRGSDKAIHSRSQRKLFLLLLDKRHQQPNLKLNGLAQVPIGLWLLWGDEYVSTRQALKALNTWTGHGQRSLEVAREGARQLLAQLDHPLATTTARARLVRVMTDIANSARYEDRERAELTHAVREVFEPTSVFAGSGMVRALGHPDAALTAEKVVTHTEAMCTAIAFMRRGRVDQELLERARDVYHRSMSEYLARLPTLAAAAPAPLAGAFSEPTLDDRVNAAGGQLLVLIGYELLHRQGGQVSTGSAPKAQSLNPAATGRT
jgi:hypothetical protein